MTLSQAGDALAVVALAGVLAVAWITWRRPFVGLGALVAGMAFHNFLIMVLLRLGTSQLLVRVVQVWKEGILALLVVIAGLRLLKAYREGRLGRPTALDWVAAAFFLVMVVYLLLPSGVLHSTAGLQARLAAFRLVALMPVLYALGRSHNASSESDLSVATWLIVGAGAIVGLFGMIELWLIPTRVWLDWGVNDFSAWLGFQYHGPQSLPENFFQTVSGNTYLRRMASTYISPLGIAYTGLLVVPIAVVLATSRRISPLVRLLAGTAVVLVIAGILFSVTRLAMIALVGEVALLVLIVRRPFVYALAPPVLAAVAVVILFYPKFGPLVDQNLNPTSLPPAASLISAGDPSFTEHLRSVIADLRVAIKHPLGDGLGSSGTSAIRFGGGAPNSDYAPGESAVLTMFVDTGVVGGAAYLLFYVLGIYAAARGLMAVAHKRTLEAALPMAAVVGGLALIPITLTSDVWGDLSVTFLFWWAVGYGAMLAARQEEVSTPVTASVRGQVAS